MTTAAWYCTREDVMGAVDVQPGVRMHDTVDRAVLAGTRAVDRLCHRHTFAPVVATYYWDWPDPFRTVPWRLWLGKHTLISLTGMTAAGSPLTLANLTPYPDWGPPYTRIEANIGSSTVFAAGQTTQKALGVTGLWGWSDDADPAGQLAGSVNASTTAVTVTDTSQIGVGSLLQVDTERLQVVDKTWSSTGLTSVNSMAASQADATITLSGTSGAPVAGEMILVGSERMLVTDVAATTCSVKRAQDGTILATHPGGATISAPRTLTVIRAARGTTAASHTAGAALTVWVPPALVGLLAAAEAINTLMQRQSGYARIVGQGESARESSGKGLADLRAQVYAAYGRKIRKGAI